MFNKSKTCKPKPKRVLKILCPNIKRNYKTTNYGRTFQEMLLPLCSFNAVIIVYK